MNETSPIRSVTVDTNSLPLGALEQVLSGRGIRWQIASPTLTELSDDDARVVGVQSEPAQFVLGESRLDIDVLSSEALASQLDQILRIVSNGSFPVATDQSSELSAGQTRQLRDAMIFDTHVRSGFDVFVTRDKKGFINDGRREMLERLGRTLICTPDELLSHLDTLPTEGSA